MDYCDSKHKGHHRMRISALTVSIGYSDIFSEFLRFNLPHFDKLIVVTNKEMDEKIAKQLKIPYTMDLCDKYSVECIDTDVMFMHKNIFNKAAAINLGLKMLHDEGWILHLDSDIIISNSFRHLLNKRELDEDTLYGADRIDVSSYERWQETKDDFLYNSHGYHCLIETHKCVLMGRYSDRHFAYAPPGYFQLWNAKKKLHYPMNAGTATRSDIAFSLQFNQKHRQLLPEILVAHLSSISGKLGCNWQMRTSPKFEPSADGSKVKGFYEKDYKPPKY